MNGNNTSAYPPPRFRPGDRVWLKSRNLSPIKAIVLEARSGFYSYVVKEVGSESGERFPAMPNEISEMTALDLLAEIE
jgi:hypothetical protein